MSFLKRLRWLLIPCILLSACSNVLSSPPAPTVIPSPTAEPAVDAFTMNKGLAHTVNIGNAIEVRDNANTITLLGSCSSITVTGNGNHVFWQSGSPIITKKGNENIISQR